MSNLRNKVYIAAITRAMKRFAMMAGENDIVATVVGSFLLSDNEAIRYVDQAEAWCHGVGIIDQKIKEPRLASIFNHINGGDGNMVFPFSKLTHDDQSCFPVKAGTSEGSIARLWKEFNEECSRYSRDLDVCGDGFLSMMRKYMWCIPADSSKNCNTSLFDYAKTLAAFSICIYDQDKCVKSDNEFPIILVGGDVSGIQKYIYNIASRKAAVSLKGRSFYLQLLVDSAIQRIKAHPNIQAKACQVIYSSGGKFYILLPNTNDIVSALAELRKEFDHALFHEQYGQLALNVAHIPFGLSPKNPGLFATTGQAEAEVGLLWKALADKLTELKCRKFEQAIDYDLFKVHKVNAEHKVCAVTGIEASECVPIDPNEEPSTYVLPIVRKQADLGRKLKDARYIASWRFNGSDDSDIDILGISYRMISGDFHSIPFEAERVWSINDTSQPIGVRTENVLGYSFYGGNSQATNLKGDNKTFEDLADGQYLGVLRMDVDNLGAIFIKGLPENARSFAAYSTLSFLLDFFFSGYLNTIREKDEFKDFVNILYSGGDDVFAIGRWDKAILFAEAIRKEFEAFCGRKDISISGGVAIVKDRFPISKSAQLAGDAEDSAKNDLGNRKNALNLFGHTISWEEEFNKVDSIHNQFIHLCQVENMSRSILHKIMELSLTIRDENGKLNPRYLWMTAYYLKRFIGNSKSQEVSDFCRTLQTDLCNERNYELTAIAARWAELELRFNKQ